MVWRSGVGRAFEWYSFEHFLNYQIQNLPPIISAILIMVWRSGVGRAVNLRRRFLRQRRVVKLRQTLPDASLMRMRVIMMMMRSKRMSILMVSKKIEFWEMIVDDVKDFWQFRDETAALLGMWEHMKLKWVRKKSQILGELDKSANKFSEKISSLPYHQPSNGDSLKILPNTSRFFYIDATRTLGLKT